MNTQLTEAQARDTRRLVIENGESRTAELLGINMQTLARAAARFGLRRATYARLAARLAELTQRATATDGE